MIAHGFNTVPWVPEFVRRPSQTRPVELSSTFGLRPMVFEAFGTVDHIYMDTARAPFEPKIGIFSC